MLLFTPYNTHKMEKVNIKMNFFKEKEKRTTNLLLIQKKAVYLQREYYY